MSEQREQELLARIAELEAENAQLRAENARLRRQLSGLQERVERIEQEARKLHRQATPFAKEKPKADPRPPGRKAGQGRFGYRARPEKVDETIPVSLACCPECHGPLKDRKIHEHFQQDLVVQVVTRRYVTESGYCQRCGKRQRSRAPEQMSGAQGAAGVCLGPKVRALASDLKHRLGVSYEKISDVLATHFDFGVSRSGLCQADGWLARQAEPIYQELVQAIRAACVVHVDETGWRVGNLSAWLWVFTNQQLTVYAIDERRSHEVVVRILGREFRGILHSDCFSAYDHAELSAWLQQKCLAHLLKDLKQMKEAKGGRALQFAVELADLLQSAIRLRDLKPDLDTVFFRREAARLERRLDALIAPKRRFSDSDNRRMAKRLRKQRRHLFRFLYQDEVEATNNQAERMLRPAVVMRKTCRCNKTARGAHTHKVLASIFATCRQQNRDVAAYITGLLQGTAPSLAPAVVAHPP